MPRHKLIAGNWKMNGLSADLAFLETIGPAAAAADAEVLICPPATLLAEAARRAGAHGIKVGGQDCHAAVSGAHTGDISASMLRDAGASHVILGHSERRCDHGETDSAVRNKAVVALEAGLVPVICVGETQGEREAGREEAVIAAQLAGSLPEGPELRKLVIAYEPVWAIGTGLTARPEDVQAMHAFIRTQLPDPANTQILYGGSVKPDNASTLLGLLDVDGALVGGASLKADDFIPIIEAGCRESQLFR